MNKTLGAFGSFILFAFYSVLGFLVPEYADTNVFVSGFLNLSGMSAVVLALTELVKKLVKYNSETHWNWWPVIISGIVSIATGFFAMIVDLPGIYAAMEQWYEVLLTAIIVTGLANRVYDSDFGYKLIKLLTGQDVQPITTPPTNVK